MWKEKTWSNIFIMIVMTIFITSCGQNSDSSIVDDANPSVEDTNVAPTDNAKDNTEVSPNSDIEASSIKAADGISESPTVLFTSDISPEGLVNIYTELGFEPKGKVGIKLSTGEPPASNYLRPELIKDLVQSVDGTIVECMTAYGGSRSSIEMHKQVAEDHGFTSIADFDLLDEEGEIDLPISTYSRIGHHTVGSHFTDYDSYIILSHFKGHSMAGFGGAIKNIAIGFGSKHGKVYIHSAGTRTEGSIMHNDEDAWLEAMAEAGLGIKESMNESIVYINVMNRLSVDCDCDGNPKEPDIHDIGILASTDPVALDQACVDLIYKAEGNKSLVKRIESKHGIHTLEHAKEIGLGSREYTLVNIDE